MFFLTFTCAHKHFQNLCVTAAGSFSPETSMIPVNGYQLGRRREAMAATRDDAFYAMSWVTPLGSNHITDMSQVVIAKLCRIRERNHGQRSWQCTHRPVQKGQPYNTGAILLLYMHKTSLFLQDQANRHVCRPRLYPTARDGHISE